MGKEMSAGYYDEVYSKRYNPNIPFIYDRIEHVLCEKFKSDALILELGCGIGVLGRQLLKKFPFYCGIDFSPVAIEVAKGETDSKHSFLCISAYDNSLYNTFEWQAIVATQVFEHVDDMAILKLVKSGTFLVFSVPINDDIAHVRTYPNANFIKQYYKSILSIKDIVTFADGTHTKNLVTAYKR